MTVPSAFQARMMRSAVEEHAKVVSHTSHCCEIAGRYANQLKELGNSEPVAEPRRISKPSTTSEKLATQGQIVLVWNMLADRKCSPEESERWAKTLRQEVITSATIREIIDTLGKRPFLATSRGSDAMVRRPNGPQLRYLKGLLEERVWEGEVDFDELTFTSISKLIDQIKEAPRKPRPEPVGDGIYVLDGIYVKVLKAVHGSGRRYTKVFDPETQSWEAKGRLLGKLTPSHKVSQEQAKSFGDLYGRCVKCSAVLTDEESIERGMGPVCAEKMGF